jgi:hypothetical protein
VKTFDSGAAAGAAGAGLLKNCENVCIVFIRVCEPEMPTPKN